MSLIFQNNGQDIVPQCLENKVYWGNSRFIWHQKAHSAKSPLGTIIKTRRKFKKKVFLPYPPNYVRCVACEVAFYLLFQGVPPSCTYLVDIYLYFYLNILFYYLFFFVFEASRGAEQSVTENRLVVGLFSTRGNEIFIYIYIFISSLWYRGEARR